MDVEFEFKEKNGGACVTKLLAPGAVCVVPESLGGLPVTELADKVFSGSTVEKVYLPRTLTRIGRYEFYGCEKLQEIHFYGALREVGGGVFTGCRNIRSLTVHMGVDEESALRDFVTEINERVTVHVFIQSGQNRMQDERDTDSARISLASSTFEEENGETETARVIFPEYYDEAVENTPARITSFKRTARITGRIFSKAPLNSIDAPIAISPSGVASTATFFTVFSRITGIGSFKTDHTTPVRIPTMIGLVMIPCNVLRISAPFTLPRSGRITVNTTTAIML